MMKILSWSAWVCFGIAFAGQLSADTSRPQSWIEFPVIPAAGSDRALEACLSRQLALHLGQERKIVSFYGPLDSVNPRDLSDRSSVHYLVFLDAPRGVYQLKFITDDSAGWSTDESLREKAAARMYSVAQVEKSTARGENIGPESFSLSLDSCTELLGWVGPHHSGR